MTDPKEFGQSGLFVSRGDALCYVEGPWAWFTTAPIESQIGDDWNDAPYDCNAGTPYEWREWMGDRGIAPYRLLKVAFDGPLLAPCDGGFLNCPWSVQDINRRAVPWLRDEKGVLAVWAGIGLMEFSAIVRSAGGHIYTDAR